MKIDIPTTLSVKLIKLRNLFYGKKILCIIGCGRSGTNFSNQYFENLGLKIGHEKLKKNGISSWCLVPNTTERLWGPSWQDIKHFDKSVFHQVRHPLKVISSLQTITTKSWDFISKFIPIKKQDCLILKAMKYWYYWNLLAEKKAIYTYKVEDIDKELDKIFQVASFKMPEDKNDILKKISRKVNTRKHSSLTWKDLEKEDKELTRKIKSLAKRYGYKV